MTILKEAPKIQFLRTFKELFNESWRNIILYGGRDSGKSYHTALALLARGRHKRLRILCTREIQNTIKDSVHKLLSDIIRLQQWTDYHITDNSIINTQTGTEFIFKGLRHNVLEIKSTEGLDITWVEEAQSASAESLEILVPTMRKPGSQLIFTFNRLNELDPVYVKYVMNRPANTFVKKVNFDVLDKVGLISPEIKKEIEEDRSSPELFAHKWLGEPIGQAEKAIISRLAVLEAMQREVADDGIVAVGVDVARMGDDRTVFFKRKGFKEIGKEIHHKLRTNEVCDALESFIQFSKNVRLYIDDTGVGGGVTDEMIRRGYDVTPVNFGGEPNDKDKYPNLISEAWFHLAGIMDQIGLKYDSDLLMELSTRQWRQDDKGKRRVESKNDYKKRGFRSPDIADACIISFYEPGGDRFNPATDMF